MPAPGDLVESDLFEVMRTSMAIRRYRDIPVPPEVLRRCLRAATWAPTGANRQGWRFCVLESDEVRQVLGRSYRTGWELARSHTYGAMVASPKGRRAFEAMETYVAGIEQVPLFVLPCAEDPRLVRELAASVQGQHEIVLGSAIYPAVQNFLLALRAHGLGGVMSTWHRHGEEELRDLVGVPDHWIIACTITVGYPQGSHHPVKRGAVEEVVFGERWGTPLWTVP